MPSPIQTHDTTEERSSQVEALVSTLWESEVEPRLPKELEVQAKKRGALQRKRGLSSAAQLLRALLASVLCAPSFRRVGAWGVLIGLADRSETAWRKKLRQASDWLAWLLAELLAVPSRRRWLAQRSSGRVLAVDGTRLKQVGGSGDDWRLHTSYDLRAGRLAEVTVSDEHTAESLAHTALQAGDIVVGDNGYGSRCSVATLAERQGDGVFGITAPTFPFQDGTGQAIDVQAWLKQAGEAVRSLACWCCSHGRSSAVRLIVLQLSREAAQAARERKIKKAHKDGRSISEATLFFAGWIRLITTLPEASWSDEDVLRLSRARWQIELFFTRLKQLLGLSLLRCVHPERVQAAIRLVLVAWALQQEVAQQLRASLLSAAQLVSLPPEPLLLPAPQALEQAPVLVQETDLAPSEVVSSWLLCDLCLETLRKPGTRPVVSGRLAGLCAALAPFSAQPSAATWASGNRLAALARGSPSGGPLVLKEVA